MLIKTTPRGVGRTSFRAADGSLECIIDVRSDSRADFSAVMSGSFARA